MKKRYFVPFICASLLCFANESFADFTRAMVHVSSAYTVLGTEDEVIVDATPLTITLPAASGVLNTHPILIRDATNHVFCTSSTVCNPFNITLVPNGSDTVDGATLLRFQGQVTIISDHSAAWQTTKYILDNLGTSASYGATAFSSTVSVVGLTSLNGGLAMDTSVLTVADTTGVISWVPTTTSLSAGTFDFSTLTSGNGVKMIGVDGTLNGGKYINIFGGTGTTSVWSVGESGATVITPNVGTVTAEFIDGTASTSGDLLKLKAVDGTLNGGLFINALGGAAGATAQFTVGEGGVVVAAGLSTAAGFKSSSSVILRNSAGDILIEEGTTVPVDTTSGYAKGAQFIDTDVVSGTSGLYVNVGTNTSCVFKLVTNA